MAYTKQTWACGDEITAEKLNHMEDGIENAGGGMVVTMTWYDSLNAVLDKTYAEISAALNEGINPVIKDTTTSESGDSSTTVYAITGLLENTIIGGKQYTVLIEQKYPTTTGLTFNADSPTGILTYSNMA